MAKYLCQGCNNNNHGWCPIKQMNGLKKLGFINPNDCRDYDRNDNADTFVTFRKGLDGDNQPHMTISINKEIVFLPTSVIQDFINSKSPMITITIPGGE